MSDNELGRPSYKTPAAKPPNAGVPPRQRDGGAKPGTAGAGRTGRAGSAEDDAGKGADAGRRSRKSRDAPEPTAPPWAGPPQPETPQKPELPRKPKASQKPDAEAKALKKKAKPEDLPPEAARTIYVPVRQNRGAGYALWAVLRFIVLAIVKVVVTMVKIALSPFHAMGG